MFVDVPPRIEFSEPWLESSEARMRQLTSKRRRIAYFYEKPDSSTFRYRAFNPGRALAGDANSQTSASWFDLKDLKSGIGFLEAADALVLCRTRYDAAVANMVARAKSRDIPVLFDCDDMVFGVDRIHLLFDSLNIDMTRGELWDAWFASCGRIGASMRMCDGFIGTNAFLAARAREFLPSVATRVMSNFLNPAQQAVAENIYSIKKNGWKRDDKIHVGYFSGSPTHMRDFAIAAPAIGRLMRRDPRVVLRIVGYLDPHPALVGLGDRIEICPFQDFLNLQRLIAEVEINVAPLQENAFTNCKSELKFFEAAICGTLTLATPTFAFERSISNGQTGLLVAAHRWDQALCEAINIVENRDAYGAICDAAFEYVKLRYGWSNQTRAIESAVFGSIPTDRPFC